MLNNEITQYIPKIIKYGKLNVIEWLSEKTKYPSKDLSYAIGFNRLDIIELMVSKNILINANVIHLNIAARRGYLDMLKLIFKLTGLLPNSEGANYAFVNNHIEIVEWLKSHNIIIDKKVIGMAAVKNNLNLLKILDLNGFKSDMKVANEAAKRGNIEILE